MKLECGCVAKLSTGRWRVAAAVAACVFGDAIRRGKWCVTHGATCQVVEMLGVVRE